MAFYLGYIAISLRCSTERNLSGRLVSLAAWQFSLFTALFPNDTVIRLIRCFCFKKAQLRAMLEQFGQSPVCYT